MIDHEPWEELCTLAAAGSIDVADRELLARHCAQCDSCRDCLLAFECISHQMLLHAKPASPMPAGSVERFRSRLAHEGIAVTQTSETTWRSCVLCSALVMAMLFFTARSLSPHLPAEERAYSGMPAVEIRNVADTAEAPPVLRSPLHSSRARRASMPLRQKPNAAFLPASSEFVEPHPLLPREEPKLAFNLSLYPELGSLELDQPEPFRRTKEPLRPPTFGLAKLEFPSASSAAEPSFDFAENLRQLRFQIPSIP